MKAKVTKLNKVGLGRTATLAGKFQGKDIEIYLSNSNSSWDDNNGNTLELGKEVEIADDRIAVSNQGRYFIQRLTFQTEEKILKGLEIAARKRALGF